MSTILVAGCTGYVGRYVTRELKRRGHRLRALTRDSSRLSARGPFGSPPVVDDFDEVAVAQVTDPASLAEVCSGVDAVFSSVGISRQRDGLTFDQVDYQANQNLIDRAVEARVGKFVYVSLWDPEPIAHLEIVRAHEKVVAALAASGLAYTVVRPSGYFSDMGALLDMARRGRSFVLGPGNNRMNPIHGADLARVCADAFETDATELGAGGPETLTQREAAELAFEVLGKRARITHLPMWLCRGLAQGVGLLSRQFGDLADFIVTAGEIDGVAPSTGTITLREYFEQLAAD